MTQIFVKEGLGYVFPDDADINNYPEYTLLPKVENETDKANELIVSQAQDIRRQRDELLIEADSLINIAHDNNDTDSMSKLKTYRQNLRDVPQGDNFPMSVSWPVKPE